jgi:hypothetical protein
VSDEPLDLDRHRGVAAQKATDIRRILAEVENNARSPRDRQGILESQLLAVPAASCVNGRPRLTCPYRKLNLTSS